MIKVTVVFHVFMHHAMKIDEGVKE